MKAIRQTIFFALVLIRLLNAQVGPACDSAIFSDDYTNPAAWTFNLTAANSISIFNGTLNYNAAYCSDYNIASRNLPFVLSKQYWKAECVFTPFYGNSPGHYVMAFTAGVQDPISQGPPTYALTNQDAIVIYYAYPTGPTSYNCCTNPNFGPWRIVARAKKGNTLYPESTGIPVTNLSAPAYVRFEMFQNAHGKLSIYSDSLFSNHVPGSPVEICVDSTITGLNRIQQGVITWGSSYRELTASIDKLTVTNKFFSSCDSIIYNCDPTFQTTQLNIPLVENVSYSWSPSNGLSCTACADPVVTIPPPGASITYTLTTVSQCGSFTDSFFVSNQCPDSLPTSTQQMNAPCFAVQCSNIFTPNGDGLNDFFSVSHCGLKNFHCSIYNRWGQLEFTTQDPETAWSGMTQGGRMSADGIYYYRITATAFNNEEKEFVGCFLLSR
jgi:gliding motility-associated-like protein